MFHVLYIVYIDKNTVYHQNNLNDQSISYYISMTLLPYCSGGVTRLL